MRGCAGVRTGGSAEGIGVILLNTDHLSSTSLPITPSRGSAPEAADLFESFSRIRIGTADHKIAAIAIVTDALLLTANRRDFEKVPGLRFDNWMD